MLYKLTYYIGGELYTKDFDSSHYSNLLEAVIEFLQAEVITIINRPSFTLTDEENEVILDESTLHHLF